MLGTRYEEYSHFINGLPFLLNTGLKRSCFYRSTENNWHENLEIQLCTSGQGSVLLDGQKYAFTKDDMVIVNANVLHYTGTETELNYDCLIISTDFCRQAGIDPESLLIEPLVRNPVLMHLFTDLKTVYFDVADSFRIAKLHKITLELLITLAEQHSIRAPAAISRSRKFETVKNTISYIRQHYPHRVTLDEIAKAVLCDKYTLCKDFKKLTGQTIIENLNHYRCIKAIDCLSAGHSVTDTASLCGFENLSFFTQTFKRYVGKLPSEYKL